MSNPHPYIFGAVVNGIFTILHMAETLEDLKKWLFTDQEEHYDYTSPSDRDEGWWGEQTAEGDYIDLEYKNENYETLEARMYYCEDFSRLNTVLSPKAYVFFNADGIGCSCYDTKQITSSLPYSTPEEALRKALKYMRHNCVACVKEDRSIVYVEDLTDVLVPLIQEIQIETEEDTTTTTFIVPDGDIAVYSPSNHPDYDDL